MPTSKNLDLNSSDSPGPPGRVSAGSTANPVNDVNEAQLKRKKRLARAKERRTTFVLGIVMVTFTGEENELTLLTLITCNG